ncbi:ABC transporter permease [Patescibacteria group bacterium]|nr:ABC transporter permease [Patescibacteria group bacterium]MBU4023012.1 ABC transporter permease [Patescibacteria group bacterium]
MAEVKEYFKIGIRNIKTRRLRSWLTILGIVVGIFLVIALISLSSGLKNSIMKQLNALGGDIIMVMPGSMDNLMMTMAGGQKLSKEDIQAVKEIRNVDVALHMDQRSQFIRFNNVQKSVYLIGMPWDEGKGFLTNFQGWDLREGTWPTPGKRELIAGSIVADEDFFGQELTPGDTVVVNGRKFKVKGILNSVGNQQDDMAIYVDWPIYQETTGDRSGDAFVIMVRPKDGVLPDDLAEEIEDALDEIRKRRRGTDVSDFSVITSEKMSSIAGGITGAIQVAVFLFAAISIFVGGLSITNTMYTAVRERTREIGVMKAVGATNKAIITIFLIESGIVGLVGGAGGVIFGLTVAKLVEYYVKGDSAFGLEAYISPQLIIFGLLFSFFVGCMAGYFPARRAAKLKPTEALRSYE